MGIGAVTRPVVERARAANPSASPPQPTTDPSPLTTKTNEPAATWRMRPESRGSLCPKLRRRTHAPCGRHKQSGRKNHSTGSYHELACLEYLFIQASICLLYTS